MTDVLIAGGGPAGASLAILLGRAGFSVELHDRARFPREKPCGEGLMPAGVAVLERLGVRVDGAPFEGIRYHHGDLTAEGRFPTTPGLPDRGLGLRRLHLDHALWSAAASTPGVRVYEGSLVREPVVEDGTVRGVIAGNEVRRARLVVAADGTHSALRRQLGLEVRPRRARFGLRVHYDLGRETPDSSFVEVYLARRHELYVTPLPRGQVQVSLLVWRQPDGVPAAQLLAEAVAGQPRLALRLQGGVQVTGIKGRSPLASSARARCVPGCVLLGDAAGFLDPVTGGGMAQALTTSQLLADHLCTGFDPGLDHLLAYDRKRQKVLADYRMLTAMVLESTRFPGLPPLLLRLLRRRPVLFSHLLGVAGGVRRLAGGVSNQNLREFHGAVRG